MQETKNMDKDNKVHIFDFPYLWNYVADNEKYHDPMLFGFKYEADDYWPDEFGRQDFEYIPESRTSYKHKNGTVIYQ